MIEMHLKLGVIGFSEGNGHPYSWSSIFNGYDPLLMENCGFPAIPRYLSKQSFPEDCIKNAKVTDIWTQDKKISKKIAEACYIENITDHINDLVNKVDAVLLARDDAKNHLSMSEPFLEAGIPIYIDKPLALNVKQAKKIFSLQKYKGQVFTCSALRYAKEFILTERQKDFIGEIKSIEGFTSKSWDQYAVHIIEPILNLIPNHGNIDNYSNFHSDSITRLNILYENGIDIHFSTYGNIEIPLKINIHGKKGSLQFVFKDTFHAFYTALDEFIKSIRNKTQPIHQDDTLEIVRLIEIGRLS